MHDTCTLAHPRGAREAVRGRVGGPDNGSGRAGGVPALGRYSSRQESVTNWPLLLAMFCLMASAL